MAVKKWRPASRMAQRMNTILGASDKFSGSRMKKESRRGTAHKVSGTRLAILPRRSCAMERAKRRGIPRVEVRAIRKAHWWVWVD
jgi:hypothetical protein